jgi:hypothetical protein
MPYAVSYHEPGTTPQFARPMLSVGATTVFLRTHDETQETMRNLRMRGIEGTAIEFAAVQADTLTAEGLIRAAATIRTAPRFRLNRAGNLRIT